ncbi:Csu type fimbrial protein [Lysobacter sp. A289]
MNRLRFLIVLLLALSALVTPPAAHAAATCSILESDLSFGTVEISGSTDVTGSISYECDVSAPGNGNSGHTMSLQACIGLGNTTSGGGNVYDRRLAGIDDANGPNPDTLPFQLYTDVARSQAWGESSASTPPYLATTPVIVTPPSGESRKVTGTVYVYGRIPSNTLVAPGSYAGRVAGNLYFGSVHNDKIADCMGGGGGSVPFFFLVSASVPGHCSVVTASDMNFSPGGMPLSGTSTGPLTSSSTIDLTCTNRTAWQVGLDDGMKPSSGGSRQMCNPGGACIAYQLTQPDGTTPWGVKADGNTVDGISAGTQQTRTVNGSVTDQPLTQAGRYTDTVKVILTY